MKLSIILGTNIKNNYTSLETIKLFLTNHLILNILQIIYVIISKNVEVHQEDQENLILTEIIYKIFYLPFYMIKFLINILCMVRS